MEKRFFLDGVDTKAARITVGQKDEIAAVASPEQAVAGMSLRNFAMTRAKIALDSPVRELFPVSRGGERSHNTIMPDSGELCSEEIEDDACRGFSTGVGYDCNSSEHGSTRAREV